MTTTGDANEAIDGRRRGTGIGAPTDVDPMARLQIQETRKTMTRLPDAVTDPFVSLLGRLKATLGLYRFTSSGGSLLDWAVVQSGLSDPLSTFNRHELEQFFQQFTVARDQHLKRLAQDLKKQDPAGFAAVMAQAPPVAQQALRRLDAMR